MASRIENQPAYAAQPPSDSSPRRMNDDRRPQSLMHPGPGAVAETVTGDFGELFSSTSCKYVGASGRPYVVVIAVVLDPGNLARHGLHGVIKSPSAGHLIAYPWPLALAWARFNVSHPSAASKPHGSD